MPAIRVEFHRLAWKDYDEACKWYSERSAETKQRFKAAVEAAVLRICKDPELFPQFSGGYSWVRVQRFRYILVFRPRSPQEIVIVAVAHSSRRPRYWHGRT
jgi:toxin ParE1/3/4